MLLQVFYQGQSAAFFHHAIDWLGMLSACVVQWAVFILFGDITLVISSCKGLRNDALLSIFWFETRAFQPLKNKGSALHRGPGF